MTSFYITLIVVFGVIILTAASLFLFALYINKKTFGSRHDKNPVLKYFTAEDFGLTAEQVDISCVKNEYIRGVIYKKEGVTPIDGRLIIFCHGMGPGHIAYTTEIAYFCNLGYTVLAPDYYGSNLSDGKDLKNNDSALNGVLAAIFYAEANLNFSKIFLVGHSWGAYSALCAANKVGIVSAVVSISAPDKSEKIMYNTLCKRMPKFFATLLYPFICLVCGGESSAKAAEEFNAPVLLIHGEKDPLVPLEISAFGLANGEHITKYLAKNKRHNPYNTVEAEKKLSELLANLSGLKNHTVAKAFFDDFDFVAATEEDIEVMDEIARFLARI